MMPGDHVRAARDEVERHWDLERFDTKPIDGTVELGSTDIALRVQVDSDGRMAAEVIGLGARWGRNRCQVRSSVVMIR